MADERRRPKREETGPGPGGLGDVFAGPETGGAVTVCHGPYSEDLPVGNMSVGEVRRRFSDRLDIDPQSQAVIDGNEVDDSTVLRGGQLLAFIRQAGEKGGRRRSHGGGSPC